MKNRSHIVIGDGQVKPWSDLRHIGPLGKYLLDSKPDVIVCIGDWWDMPSLSSYDKGTKRAEGLRYNEDIHAGKKAMWNLLKPIRKYNEKMKLQKKGLYKPEMHFTLGNHEERIARHIQANPLLSGQIGYQDLCLKEFGFQMHDFLTPVIVDGIEYVHYVQNRNSPRPKSSSKLSLDQTKMSVTQGHRPCLDIHTDWADDKGMMWSITVGSTYLDDEHYKGAQCNKHWRGIVHKFHVKDGSFDPLFLSLESLMEMYPDA